MSIVAGLNRAILRCVLVVALGGEASTTLAQGASAVTIEITSPPPAGSGPHSWGNIAGRTTGASPSEHRVVLYAHTDKWYVQPWITEPFTPLRKDGTFVNGLHLGDAYAVLLVDRSYVPLATLGDLPGTGTGVLAIIHAPAASR
jgi:hypothetical protein